MVNEVRVLVKKLFQAQKEKQDLQIENILLRNEISKLILEKDMLNTKLINLKVVK